MKRGGLLLAVVAMVVSLIAAMTHRESVRRDGEYGLWVHWQSDTVAVHWITRAVRPGFLEVESDGRQRYRTETPSDTQHVARFRDPGQRTFTLRYGAAGDTADLHETTIRTRPSRPRVSWGGADSVFIVSDIHGEFDRLVRLLRNAGLIGADLRWTGGRKQLAVLGDVLDRGDASLRALWFLYGLEPQAERAGGRLHLVLGNHEIMVMAGDLRYVAPAELETARLHGASYADLFHPQNSALGRWLVSRPVLMRIGDILLAHGGVSSDWLGWNLETVQDSLSAWTREELFARWMDSTYAAPLDSAGLARRASYFWGPRSILWYRGYAQGDGTPSDTATAELHSVLRRFDARLHVVGHTPHPTIRQRFNGAYIEVNTVPFAAEALLLVRRGNGWDRFRYRESGPAESLQ